MGSKSWSRILADELGHQGAKQALVLVLAATLLVLLQGVTNNYALASAVPGAPSLYLPPDGTYTDDNTVYFEWAVSADADNYQLLVDNDSDFSSPEENVLLEATDNTYTISALGLADENYSWKVIAINAFGENESSIWTFVIDTINPLLPTLYLPADGIVTNDNTVYFEWSKIDNANNYRLFIDNDSDFDSPEVKITTDENYYTSSALPDKSYFWRVKARSSEDNSEKYNSANRTFLIDTIAPVTPTLASPGDNVVGSALTQTFTWTEPEAGVTYDIQIDNETSFTLPYVHVNTGLADNSYTYTFASNGGVYYWRVRAVDTAYNQSSWADNFRLAIQAPPGQPMLYLSSDGVITNENTPTFEWSVGALADNHLLLVDNDPDFSSPEENRIVLDNYYTIADEDSLPDDNYSWKVIAINVYGKNESSTWTFVIDIVATAIPTLVSPGTDAVESALTQTFTWTEPEVSVTYDIQIDNDRDFTSPYVLENTGLTDNSYTHTFASYGVYYWRVRAIDTANNQSLWSDNFKLTIQVPQSEPNSSEDVISSGDDSPSPTPVSEDVPPPSEGALTVTIGTIKTGEKGSADFTQYAIAVTEVGITTTSDVSGARVDVVMHVAKPAGIAEITLPVYTYFDLSTIIGTDYISGATIKFKVARSWIAKMNIDEDTIRLFRCRGGWQRLATEIIGADSYYLYYEATTSGFSLFAVAGEQMVAPTPTPWVTPTVPSPTQSPSPLYAALFMTAGVFGFAMAYRLTRPSRYSVMLKRLKQLAREPIRTRVRSIGPPSLKPPARVPEQVSRAEPTAPKRLKRIRREKLLKEQKACRKLKDIKQKLWITERELRRMEEDRWLYTKNMLKFGFAAWVFGLSVFLFAIVLISVKLFGGTPLAWTSMLVGTLLLGGAHAAPVSVTAVSVRKYDTKIKRLRCIRKGLVAKYQSAVLQYVGGVAGSA